jgi:hypothetical protein
MPTLEKISNAIVGYERMTSYAEAIPVNPTAPLFPASFLPTTVHEEPILAL